MTGGSVRQEYTLAQLAAAVGMTERNVRAYRSRGLIRPPRMRGRVGYYDLGHLSQLRLVQALTGRGLSLQVVGQLMEKNLAEHELARLIREDLPEGPSLPVSRVVIDELNQEDPTLFDPMIEHGVARLGETGVESDPALMALAFQLAGCGVPLGDVARVVLAGARAAAAAEECVRHGLRASANGTASTVLGNGVPARDRNGNADAAESTKGHDIQHDAAQNSPDAEPEDAPETQPSSKPRCAGPQPLATTVAVELAAMAFRISLEWRLSRRER